MRALIFGDSLAAGIQLKGFDCEIVSIAGESTYGLLHRYPHLEYYFDQGSYDIVVFIAGTNDMASDALPIFAIQNLVKMHMICKQYRITNIATSIMHDGFNAAYKEQCLKLGIPMCMFLSEDINTSFLEDDGVHLNDAGKKLFSDAIDKNIQNAMIQKYTRLSGELVTIVCAF